MLVRHLDLGHVKAQIIQQTGQGRDLTATGQLRVLQQLLYRQTPLPGQLSPVGRGRLRGRLRLRCRFGCFRLGGRLRTGLRGNNSGALGRLGTAVPGQLIYGKADAAAQQDRTEQQSHPLPDDILPSACRTTAPGSSGCMGAAASGCSPTAPPWISRAAPPGTARAACISPRTASAAASGIACMAAAGSGMLIVSVLLICQCDSPIPVL